MKTWAVVIIAIRIAALAFTIWVLSILVGQGLPLQWVAIFFGGILAFGSALAFLVEPFMRRAVPDLEARERALLGYSVPRRVVIPIRIAYLVLGSAAAVWGLTTPL